MPKLGPRATVPVGKNKEGKATYSYMLKSTAEYFGLSIIKTPTRKNKLGRQVSARGAVGGDRIKVPTGKKTRKGVMKYKSMPMPAGMNIPKVQAFLKRCTKNKPESFVSGDGRTWPVV